jgi:hypothetical protein
MKEVTRMYLTCVVIERLILLYILLLITKCVFKPKNVRNIKKLCSNVALGK